MKPIKTVLIIEDDRFIGEMYTLSLRQDGYEVDWQTNGKDGLNAALAKPYDLILLDIMLPEKQGQEVLAALKDDGDKVPNSRIIILTNFEQDDQTKSELQSKVDAYLIKADITPRKLTEAIQQMTAA